MPSDLKKDPLLDSFLSSLRLEKGLSENTIKAYSNDCRAFNKWLFLNKGYEPASATEGDIENYLKYFQSINKDEVMYHVLCTTVLYCTVQCTL